jgi:hypothetical protein
VPDEAPERQRVGERSASGTERMVEAVHEVRCRIDQSTVEIETDDRLAHRGSFFIVSVARTVIRHKAGKNLELTGARAAF